jgi:large subunit ribosomal protein L29
MAILRVKDIANMSSEDRETRLIDLRVELARIRTMVNAGGAVEDPTRIRELRKAIAQILTIQNEIKLGIRKAAAEPEKKQEKKPEKAEKKPKAKKKAEEESEEKTPQ